MKPPLHSCLKSKSLVGPFSKTSDANVIEALGFGGMDFAILDLEHGPNDISNLGGLIRACETSGMYSVVRVQTDEQISRALDLGAKAVQVPHVNCAADAQRAVDAARYAPQGHRGVCRYVRAARHSATPKEDYFTSANDISVIAQVEGTEGIANLDEILEVAGVDVIFVGVYDLSQSLGMTGQADHPKVLEALEAVTAKASSKGIPVGTFVESIDRAKQMRALGIHYLCYSVDVGFLYEHARCITQALNLSDLPASKV